MKKYVVKYERMMPKGKEPVYLEHEIQASSLKHAKKLAREHLGKFTVASMKLVDIHKAE